MRVLALLSMAFFLAACTPGAAAVSQTALPAAPAPAVKAPTLANTAPVIANESTAATSPTPDLPRTGSAGTGGATSTSAPGAQVTPTATLAPRKPPKYWAEWPLLPTVSARAKEIFKLGQKLGNDPHSFTVIGDCQSEPNILMGEYDTNNYQLGAGYEYLDETIQWFKGSFARDSITVKDGMSVASVFAPAWADPKQCQAGETPLDCEFRLHKPSIVIISLGTNWRGGDEKKHEEYLRKIVDYAISKGVVPILSSKGDNLEGGHRINESTARVAFDYDLPFWNFWLTLRDLPGKGIDGTRPGGYLIPEAWGRRSFTGLQALDAVWRGLKPLMNQ